MRITVRAKPGASRTRVGGRYAESTLVVAVTARAVDGAATAAVRAAVAEAFGIRPGAVRLVSGATARTKVFDLDLPDETAAARLAELLGPRPG
ncbi:MAG: DUF167 domain-containing protein [Dermatophilaceae bacterium]